MNKSVPLSATMGKSLHPTYCHCRNTQSIYCYHRPTNYTHKKNYFHDNSKQVENNNLIIMKNKNK